MAGVVGVVGEDGKGAVDLLGEDGAGEFVGQSDEAEREDEAGACACGGRPAVVGADGEKERLGAGVAEAAEVFCEGFAGKLFAAGVKENEDGSGSGGGAVEGGEEIGFGGEGMGVAGKIAGGPGEVVGGKGGCGV